MMKYYKHLTLHLSNNSFLRSISVAVLLFSVALVFNYYAGTYATNKESVSVTDLILSNTRVHDVDGLFIYGSYALVALIAFLVLRRINTLPFIIEAIALFTAIRSVFITLTHIAPFPTQITVNSDLLSKVSFGGDLFFSGHTGLPFLMALIFWDAPSLRYTFLSLSFFFATVVLLGHLHYSIDVLSAFFIAYGIFHLAEYLFKKDHKLFREGLSTDL